MMAIPKHKILLLTLLLSIFFLNSAYAFERPVNKEGVTIVKSGIFIVDLEGINSAEQNFEANVFFRFTWNDPKLAHTGKETLRKPLNEIWHPNLIILNQQRVWKTFPETAAILPNGDVSYMQRVWGTFSQPLNLSNFPFDKHKFNITFVSPSYSPKQLKLVRDTKKISGIAKELSIPDWAVITYEVTPGYYKPIPSVEAKKTAISFTFEAKRYSGYYILNIILPLILIVFMSWIVFWIDPKESGTQVAVSITSMLTLIAFRFTIRESLPAVPYLTLLDYLVLGATLLVFASLLEVIVTSSLAKVGKLEKARIIDKHSRWIFSIAFILLLIITIAVHL